MMKRTLTTLSLLLFFVGLLNAGFGSEQVNMNGTTAANDVRSFTPSPLGVSVSGDDLIIEFYEDVRTEFLVSKDGNSVYNNVIQGAIGDVKYINIADWEEGNYIIEFIYEEAIFSGELTLSYSH